MPARPVGRPRHAARGGGEGRPRARRRRRRRTGRRGAGHAAGGHPPLAGDLRRGARGARSPGRCPAHRRRAGPARRLRERTCRWPRTRRAAAGAVAAADGRAEDAARISRRGWSSTRWPADRSSGRWLELAAGAHLRRTGHRREAAAVLTEAAQRLARSGRRHGRCAALGSSTPAGCVPVGARRAPRSPATRPSPLRSASSPTWWRGVAPTARWPPSWSSAPRRSSTTSGGSTPSWACGRAASSRPVSPWVAEEHPAPGRAAASGAPATGSDIVAPRPPSPADGPVGRDAEVAACWRRFAGRPAVVVGRRSSSATRAWARRSWCATPLRAPARGPWSPRAIRPSRISTTGCSNSWSAARRSTGRRPATSCPLPGTDPLAAGATLLRFVDGLPLDRPLVVVVDDAHWADRASLDALTFAARRAPRRPGGPVPDVPARGPRPVAARPGAPGRRRRAPHRPGAARRGRGRRAGRARSTGGPVPAAAVERLRATRAATRCTSARCSASSARASWSAAHGCRRPVRTPRSCSVGWPHVARRPSGSSRRSPCSTAVPRSPRDGGRGARPCRRRRRSPPSTRRWHTGLVELVERPGERSLAFAHPLVGAAVSGDHVAVEAAGLHRAAAAVVPGAAGMRHRLAGCAGHDARPGGRRPAGRRRPRRGAARTARRPACGPRPRGSPPTPGGRDRAPLHGRRPPPVRRRPRRRRPRPPAGRRRGRRSPAVVRARPARLRARVRAATRRATSTVPGSR